MFFNLINHFIKRVVLCERGGQKESTPKPAKTQEEIALDNIRAQQAAKPAAVQLEYELNQKYLPLMTALQEDVRKNVFTGEQGIREALQKNILASLQSPTGLTPEQTAAQDAIRQRSVSDLQRAQQTRANLGGGLFGGRAQAAEMQDVSNLQNQFATQDIERERQSRLDAINAAMPFLQILFPDVALAMPQFQNPVASADTGMNYASQTRGQALSYQAQQDATRNALYSALFQGLGTAAGGALGAGGILNKG